jgi:hypothetical protein
LLEGHRFQVPPPPDAEVIVTLFVVLIAIIETDPATVGVISNPKVQLVADGEHTVIRLSCTYVQV